MEQTRNIHNEREDTESKVWLLYTCAIIAFKSSTVNTELKAM